MKSTRILLASLTLGTLAIAAPALAQEAGPGIVDPGHPRVNEVNARQANQQRRINQGIQSGSLTPAETARLEKREAHIQAREAADMSKHGGHLTKGEQRRLNHAENRESRAIHRKKHN